MTHTSRRLRTSSSSDAFRLLTQRLGPLPIVNHFLDRLGVEPLLERFVPATDRRARLGWSKALGVLLRSIIVEREPVYRQDETVRAFAPGVFGLSEEEMALLTDDHLGRALDRLFDADRGSFLTELVVTMRRRFDLGSDELHNDSTTVRFTGQYREARGRSMRGRRAPWITYGYSKDHRPDLKQLLWVLTTGPDGVPFQFRCEDGNTTDSTTHITTWEALRGLVGRSDFLYVADSKLCSMETMEHLDRQGGRFVTVLPRSRSEDKEFRGWLQTHEPVWEPAADRPNPRRRRGPRDRWWVFRHPIPSQEGWPLIWVKSSLLALSQQQSRRERIARATDELTDLAARLRERRSRLRERREVQEVVEAILGRLHVRRYLRADVSVDEEHRFRQDTPGRPGPKTRYRRTTRRRLRLTWTTDEAAIAYDHKSDGMYPLLTNDRTLAPQEVLAAHKRQPTIEKRFQQLKTVHCIAPVFLKNEGRIEAFFCLYFVALLVQALVERELRRAMHNEKIEDLPLYPERRPCRRPTTEQILRLFSIVERHALYRRGRLVQTFDPEITELQEQTLRLLGLRTSVYRHQ
jgi:transposase